jgi:hypothetical protein
MRVELDSSNWADIADVSELRSGDRRAINRTVRLELDENEKPILTGSLTQGMRDALVKRVVSNWSLPFPIPEKDPGSLDKLTLEQEDALDKAVEPHMALISGNVDPGKRGSDPTEDSAS